MCVCSSCVFVVCQGFPQCVHEVRPSPSASDPVVCPTISTTLPEVTPLQAVLALGFSQAQFRITSLPSILFSKALSPRPRLEENRLSSRLALVHQVESFTKWLLFSKRRSDLGHPSVHEPSPRCPRGLRGVCLTLLCLPPQDFFSGHRLSTAWSGLSLQVFCLLFFHALASVRTPGPRFRSASFITPFSVRSHPRVFLCS